MAPQAVSTPSSDDLMDEMSDSELLDFEMESPKTPTKIAIKAPSVQREGSFPFLKLPPELRDNIYKLCLRSQSSTGKIRLEFTPWAVLRERRYKPRSHGDDPYIQVPAEERSRITSGLLRVNRQINNESQLLLYNENTFSCHDIMCAQVFLSGIGSCRSGIRRIEIPTPTSTTMSGCVWQSTLLLLIDARRLERLTLFRTEGSRNVCDPVGLAAAFRNPARQWLQAMEAKMGDKFAGLFKIEIPDAMIERHWECYKNMAPFGMGKREYFAWFREQFNQELRRLRDGNGYSVVLPEDHPKYSLLASERAQEEAQNMEEKKT